MKRLILICLTLLTACTSAVTVTPQATMPSSTSAPTVTAPATSAAQPKVKNPTVAPVSANADFVVPEILGRPTDHSITLNVVPVAAMDIVVEYGTTAGTYDQQSAAVSAPSGSPIEITLDQLRANTRYYYRLRYANSIGPERNFMTQRAAGSTFTFGLQGDSHPERVNKQFDADLYVRTLLSAASDQPDFYLTIGDDFSVDALKTVNPQTVAAQYLNQRNWLGRVGAPVFLVNGNHEQASLANLNGTADNVAVWAQTARNAYYPQPAPDAFYTGDVEPVEFIGQLRDYYAFTWGDALFVV
ncbi:MAG: hypothetical protein KA765_11675, partial [Thermoflexales bacterium]|nr:hypothetical protein [Thermoflexales bacterium]